MQPDALQGMMRRPWPELRRPLFVAVAAAFLLAQGLRYGLGWPLPAVLTSYLADLTSMPVLLTLALATYRRLVARSLRFTLPAAWLLAAWLGVSVWFEVLLPCFSVQAVADPLDVVAYGLGTLAFGRWLNRLS